VALAQSAAFTLQSSGGGNGEGFCAYSIEGVASPSLNQRRHDFDSNSSSAVFDLAEEDGFLTCDGESDGGAQCSAGCSDMSVNAVREFDLTLLDFADDAWHKSADDLLQDDVLWEPCAATPKLGFGIRSVDPVERGVDATIQTGSSFPPTRNVWLVPFAHVAGSLQRYCSKVVSRSVLDSIYCRQLDHDTDSYAQTANTHLKATIRNMVACGKHQFEELQVLREKEQQQQEELLHMRSLLQDAPTVGQVETEIANITTHLRNEFGVELDKLHSREAQYVNSLSIAKASLVEAFDARDVALEALRRQTEHTSQLEKQIQVLSERYDLLAKSSLNSDVLQAQHFLDNSDGWMGLSDDGGESCDRKDLENEWEPGLPLGGKVRLHSLDNQALNGLSGVIREYKQTKGKYVVFLPDLLGPICCKKQATKLLSPDFLILIDADPASSSGIGCSGVGRHVVGGVCGDGKTSKSEKHIKSRSQRLQQQSKECNSARNSECEELDFSVSVQQHIHDHLYESSVGSADNHFPSGVQQHFHSHFLLAD